MTTIHLNCAARGGGPAPGPAEECPACSHAHSPGAAEIESLRRELDEARAERDRARETNVRLNRRCQRAEAVVRERLAQTTDTRGFGRILANAAAAMYRAQAEEAMDMLREWVDQHGCSCGHPACNRCADTRDARSFLSAKPSPSASPEASGTTHRCSQDCRGEDHAAFEPPSGDGG